jgi:cell division protein FtsW
MTGEGRRFDTTILLLAVVLTCFGVVMVYSSSSIMAAERYHDGFYFLKRQGLYALAGFSCMAAIMRIDYHRLRRLAVPGLLLCAFLLLLVLVPGVGARAGGAARWIRLAGFSFQPSEAVKLALVLYMAHSLAKKQDKVKSFKLGILPYTIVLALLLLLLLLQPDLGSALTLGIVAMVMLMAAGTRFSHLFSLVVLSLPFLYYAVWHVDYRRRRILAFLDPWQDPTNTGFQIIQSLIAFGTGGLVGNGLGEGKQKLFYLPEAHTDFIFSVVGEELGFAGVLVVTAMFLVLVMRGIRAALHAPDDFGRYLAFGITLLIGMQAFINIAVVMGMLPTKGLALPFISFGGTSLLTSLAAVGILLNVSSQTTGEIR